MTSISVRGPGQVAGSIPWQSYIMSPTKKKKIYIYIYIYIYQRSC